jgi:tRNA(fMet)-specific endonuclease VapC
MRRSLLDTDIFSEVLKGRNATVLRAAETYQAHYAVLTLSAVSVMELFQGLYAKRQVGWAAELTELLEFSEVLDFGRTEAEVAGRILGDLRRTGKSLGRSDPMIASIAMQHGLVLVTGNTQHYRVIQELGYPLAIENWRDARG